MMHDFERVEIEMKNIYFTTSGERNKFNSFVLAHARAHIGAATDHGTHSGGQIVTLQHRCYYPVVD